MGGTTAKSCLIIDGEPRADEHVRGRPHLPLQEGLRLPGVGAVGRPRRDRRRRRQPGPPRRPRPAEGRPRERRRRSRPGVLRPRRRPPGGHRRRPRARPARRRLLPRRRHAARPRRQPAPRWLGGRPRSACPIGDTAAGVHELVNQNMAAASRMHAVEQGEDLRGVTVLAFGGAGPIHACGVAELLESTKVVFPTNASVLSAFGTLVTPVRIDLARSKVRPLAAIDPAERDALLDELRAEGTRVLSAAGVPRRRHPLPLRARRPLPRPGQRDHAVARRGPGVAGHRRRRGRQVRGRLPPHLRPDDPRRRHRGRDVAAVGVRRGEHRRAGRRRRRRPPAPPTPPGRSASAGPPTPSTRRCTGAPRSASARSSPARRSSRSARRRPSSAPAGPSPSRPTAPSSPNERSPS